MKQAVDAIKLIGVIINVKKDKNPDEILFLPDKAIELAHQAMSTGKSWTPTGSLLFFQPTQLSYSHKKLKIYFPKQNLRN